jgi:hypothetical protein
MALACSVMPAMGEWRRRLILGAAEIEFSVPCSTVMTPIDRMLTSLGALSGSTVVTAWEPGISKPSRSKKRVADHGGVQRWRELTSIPGVGSALDALRFCRP